MLWRIGYSKTKAETTDPESYGESLFGRFLMETRIKLRAEDSDTTGYTKPANATTAFSQYSSGTWFVNDSDREYTTATEGGGSKEN